MACIYTYRGHRFTERELDEFLMSDGIEFIKKYGDEVFSSTTSALRMTHNVVAQFILDSAKIKAEHIANVKMSRELSYTEAFLELNDLATNGSYYKPITHFLKGLKSIMTDKLLMPEFIVENYFNERIKEWKEGKFKKDEFDLLFPDKNVPSTITDEMIEGFKTLIMDMWKAQADIGSEIHKGCQLYFTGSKLDGTKNVLHRTLPKELLLLLMRERLDPALLSNEHIELIYNYCFNLHLYLKKIYKCDEDLDLHFYTEMTVYGDVVHPETKENTGLIGMIDLLVVDPKGGMHIIDYKTSPHNYYAKENTEEGYSSAKKLAFTYLLNIYERLLYNALNLNPPSHSINVAPIQLDKFRKEGDKWVFDSIAYDDTFIDNLTAKMSSGSNVNSNLDLMIPDKRLKDVNGSEIFNKVGTAMEELFLVYSRIREKDESGKDKLKIKYNPIHNSKPYEIDEIKDLVDSKEPTQDDKGKFSVKIGYLIFDADTKAELYEKVKNVFNSSINRVPDHVNSIKNAIIYKKEDELDFGSNIKFDDLDIEWSLNFISEYCRGDWEVVNLPRELEALGCILLRNKNTNAVDVVKVSHNICTSYLNLVEGRQNLTAKFESDLVEDSKSDSLMLKSKRGNIDLMEIMLAINLMPSRFLDTRINKIRVISPLSLEGMTASAPELQYCFKALRKHAMKIDGGKWREYMENDNFENGNIHLCTPAEQAFNDYKAAVEAGAFKAEGSKIFRNSADELELLVYGDNPIATLEKLKSIRALLEEKYKHLNKKAKVMEKFSEDNLERIYSELDIAIADLEGIHFRQQSEDPLKYGSINPGKRNMFKGGTHIDNPGTMDNYNLNLLTSTVMLKYQHVRNSMLDGISKVRLIMLRLKNSNGFSYLKERLFGNKVNLFKGLTYRTENGDWLMVDPSTLPEGPQKEFAEYFLKVVNDNRYGESTASTLKANNDVRYYRVPLAVGGSMWQVNGALETIKFKLRSLMPKEVMSLAKDKLYNLLSETTELERNSITNALWEMTTMFDGGEDEATRLRHLNNRPEGYFEHDLEKLLLMHMHAYETKRAMDDVLPIMRAGLVFLIFSKLSQNKSYKKSLLYLLDYVKATIFNKPLITDKQLLLREYANKFMSIASKMALGFSPRLLYQGIEGIWKGIGLVLRNPTGVTLDGVNQFNKDDFIKSFFNTMKELGHFGNRRSKLELINEKYSLNDMDTNSYAARVLDDHNLLYNFNTFLFRTASRPDFYNRLTLFLTLMRADGCWEAHSVKDGKLVYDWYKDNRFSALSRGDKSDPLYNKQLALYKEMFEQMKKEKLINPKLSMYDSDGKIRPLPEAYTILQSESYKALSDMLYGYYSHERRSLIQSTLIGGLVLQMYTYWSGKKNQYLATGAIRNLGKYVHEKFQNGKPKYYQLDENGVPDYSKDPVDYDTGAPVIKWLGQFAEGVITTLSNIYRDMLSAHGTDRTMSDVWRSYWKNDDDNLRTIYRSNMILLLYELSMFTILGSFVGNLVNNAAKDYTKEFPADGNFAQAMTNTGLLIGADIFRASFLDLNFFDSIGGRGINWTPFAISTAQRTFLNWSRFFFGDRDFMTAMTKTWSSSRQLSPMLEAIYDAKNGE